MKISTAAFNAVSSPSEKWMRDSMKISTPAC
jgi:hypothetical protein